MIAFFLKTWTLKDEIIQSSYVVYSQVREVLWAKIASC